MDLWQVIAEPRRRRLVELCWDGERSVNDLHAAMEDISLGAVSQHLGRLREAGLVQDEGAHHERAYLHISSFFAVSD